MGHTHVHSSFSTSGSRIIGSDFDKLKIDQQIVPDSQLKLRSSDIHNYEEDTENDPRTYTKTNRRKSFKEKLNEWKTSMNNSFTYEVRPITFPFQENIDEWRKLFKPCASQRLFLPSVLSDIDSLLYVDTDTLFLGPLEDIWRHFDLMNSSQMAALTPEHEDPNTGWS
ncbi:Glucoside xylosyltransferase 1 [Blattella germanica]|nr:Glucoside xylosyltransferase 1 [Blattella germanica]